MTRFQVTFGAIVLAQAAHSVEEYLGRLWESFPPARFLTSLVAQNLERGFLIINVSLVAFGLWCLLWPVRLWSLRQGSYTPGVATAPLLLVLALYPGRLRAPMNAITISIAAAAVLLGSGLGAYRSPIRLTRSA